MSENKKNDEGANRSDNDNKDGKDDVASRVNPEMDSPVGSQTGSGTTGGG